MSEEYRETSKLIEGLSESERVAFHRGIYVGWFRGLRSASNNGSDIINIVQTVVRDACNVLRDQITPEQSTALRKETGRLSSALSVAFEGPLVPRPGSAGSASPHSKITEDDVLRIREERARGVALLTLSKRFGITRSQVSAIATGRKWKHVGGKITPVGYVRTRNVPLGEVVELRSQGLTFKEIGKRLEFTRSAIARAYKRATA